MKRTYLLFVALLVLVTVAMVLVVLDSLPAHAFLTDYASHDVPNVSRPALDSPTVDSVFGSTVIRRTEDMIQEYAKYAPANADNTLVAVLQMAGVGRGSWRIQGLADHTWRATLATQGDPEISWHPTDPNLLLYRKDNQILQYHVDSGVVDVLLSVSLYAQISDNQEGRPSFDWRYWAGVGIQRSGQRDLIVADLQSHAVLAVLPDVGTGLDWASMSPSGQYVVVQFTDGRGTRVYGRDLKLQRVLIADFTHADLALDKDGNDVLVYIAVTGGQINELGCPSPPNGSPIAAARLSDGQKKILLGDCYTADWQPVITGVFLPWGGAYHFSGVLSWSQPGWVLVSSYSASSVPQAPFQREVFLLATDGSGQVKRMAHHQSLTDGDYFSEPHATSSWDGSLLFFASTWESTGRYDLYQIGAGGTPPIPPLPPDPEAPFTCRTKYTTDTSGKVIKYRTQCIRQ